MLRAPGRNKTDPWMIEVGRREGRGEGGGGRGRGKGEGGKERRER